MIPEFHPFSYKSFRYDFPAGIAVFFVAVPLCLGIAYASGAPLIAGLITGIIGGIVTGLISNSQLSVSGPAAGLTAIAVSGITSLGSFEAFLVATIFAGIFQIILGISRAGIVATYIPHSVIKGMLSAIGLILILKQLPHLVGYDSKLTGIEALTENISNNTNIFTALLQGFIKLNDGVLIIGSACLTLLVVWEKFFQIRLKTIPGALIVVVFGVVLSHILQYVNILNPLEQKHFVNITAIQTIDEFYKASSFPHWQAIYNYQVYFTAITIAVVASIETLLSVEAIDKLDPLHRKTSANRELIAQGIGNSLAGLLGGLPMTAVIVRGSVNASAGAKTKVSAIIHGLLIAVAIAFFSAIINLIPLASLAAVLIYTGYKLFSPHIIAQEFKAGWAKFIPFATTIIAIIFTDLLIGVTIGLIVSFGINIFLNRT